MTTCQNCGGKLPRNTKYKTCPKCRGAVKLAADQAVVMAAMKQSGLAATQRHIEAVTGLNTFRVNEVMASLLADGLVTPRASGAKYLLTAKAEEVASGHDATA
jgi:hypothetical protein